MKQLRTVLQSFLILAILACFSLVQAQTPLDPNSLTKYVDKLPKPAKVKTFKKKRGVYRTKRLKMGMYEVYQKLHRDLPPTKVWAYGRSKSKATFPGPTLEARRGVKAKITWKNYLPDYHMFPVDETLHWANPVNWPGFGIPTVVHLHGGETKASSDGHPDAWFTRGFEQQGPAYPGKQLTYDNDQPPATLWYHDHALGMTRLNVYAGLAGFYLLRDHEAEERLNLPEGDNEIEVVIQDRFFFDDGQLRYPTEDATNPDVHPVWQPEVFGDVIVVNGVVWPYTEVEARQYRVRFLNGSNARFYNLTLSNGMSVKQIMTDGGYMREPVEISSLLLAPGERADVVIDFNGIEPGTTILVQNDATSPYPDGDPVDPNTTGQIMQIRVVEPRGLDIHDTELPSTLNTIPDLSGVVPDVVRTLTLVEEEGPGGPLAMFLDGKKWDGAPSENAVLGSTEMWQVVNMTVDTHPIHMHLVQMQLENRQPVDMLGYEEEYFQLNPVIPAEETFNPNLDDFLLGAPTGPDANEDAWKDTYRMNPGEVTRVMVRFQPIDTPLGTFVDYPFDATELPGYVWHCHILEHEDNEMMRPLRMVRAAAPKGIAAGDATITDQFTYELAQNYPNPFNPTTDIRFQLAADQHVNIEVFNMLGQVVRSLTDKNYEAGHHNVQWNGKNSSGELVPSGMYLYRIKAGEFSQIKRMVLLK